MLKRKFKLTFTKYLEMMGSVASIVSCKDLKNPNFQVQGSLSNLKCKKKEKLKKMNFLEWVFEKKLVETKLSEKAEIKLDFPDADFWIIRRGSENNLGKPTKNFNKEHIGVKIKSEDVLPQFLYYAMEYIYSKGYYRNLSVGTTNLKNIKVSDVSNIIIG